MYFKKALALGVAVMSVTVFAGKYGEAPMLQELVKQGKLPSVEKRLPENPCVVKTVENIGQYGGTAYVAAEVIGAQQYGDDTHFISFETPININPDNSVTPNLVEKWEFSKDCKKMTWHIRKGMKWSDGVPFNADDIIFWWNDEVKNPDITPVIYLSELEDADLKKIDDYTVEITFKNPYPFFPLLLTKQWGLLTKWWRPAHYLKQYNSHYTGKDKLLEKAKSLGYTGYMDYYNDIAGYSNKQVNPDCPTMCPYILKEKNPDNWVWERNPYYWKVDEKGNQLPYIDKVIAMQISDKEAIQTKLITGKLDFAGWSADVSNYPLYKKNEKTGNYKTLLWKTDRASEIKFMPNLNTKNKKLSTLFQNIKFREALSLGINRDEINKLIYFGKAVPRPFYLLPDSKYYEKQYENYFTAYEPEKANKLLDELGLDKRNSDGFRTYADGSPVRFVIEYWDEEPVQKGPVTELVKGYWNKLGLQVEAKPIARDLLFQKGESNDFEMTNWHGGGTVDTEWVYRRVPPLPWYGLCYAPLWGRWYMKKGDGVEPPPVMKEIIDFMFKMSSCTDEKLQLEYGQKIWADFVQESYEIGTVGQAPQPIIASNRLHNVPATGVWGGDHLWLHIYHPEQFYLTDK